MDNIEFSKTILKNDEMTEEEKRNFLEAVPQMTTEERSFFLNSLAAERIVGQLEQIQAVEDDAALAGEDPDEAVQEYLDVQRQAGEENRIEEIVTQLHSAGEKSDISTSPNSGESLDQARDS